MRGFNRAIIAGNLTRDPEVRYTVNKKAYAIFAVAVNNTWKNANGEVQENTDYINVVAWGAQAETCGKYLKKGSPVLVEGRIRTGSYDAKDGSGKRYTTEINADNMIMLGSREGVSGASTQSSGMSSPSPYDIPVPPEEDFGSNIGDNGFGGGGSYTSSFANGNNRMPSSDASSIPF